MERRRHLDLRMRLLESVTLRKSLEEVQWALFCAIVEMCLVSPPLMDQMPIIVRTSHSLPSLARVVLSAPRLGCFVVECRSPLSTFPWTIWQLERPPLLGLPPHPCPGRALLRQRPLLNSLSVLLFFSLFLLLLSFISCAELSPPIPYSLHPLSAEWPVDGAGRLQTSTHHSMGSRAARECLGIRLTEARASCGGVTERVGSTGAFKRWGGPLSATTGCEWRGQFCCGTLQFAWSPFCVAHSLHLRGEESGKICLRG